MPFKHQYIAVLVVELSSWIFYVCTGYMFKPASNNPYLKLAIAEEDDDDAEDVYVFSLFINYTSVSTLFCFLHLVSNSDAPGLDRPDTTNRQGVC